MSKGSDQIVLDGVGSGIPIENPLELTLLDSQDQVWISTETTQIKIRAVEASTQVSGIDYKVVNDGQVTFEGLVLKGEIGKQDVKFALSSKALNTAKISKVYGDQISSSEISVNFRY